MNLQWCYGHCGAIGILTHLSLEPHWIILKDWCPSYTAASQKCVCMGKGTILPDSVSVQLLSNFILKLQRFLFERIRKQILVPQAIVMLANRIQRDWGSLTLITYHTIFVYSSPPAPRWFSLGKMRYDLLMFMKLELKRTLTLLTTSRVSDAKWKAKCRRCLFEWASDCCVHGQLILRHLSFMRLQNHMHWTNALKYTLRTLSNTKCNFFTPSAQTLCPLLSSRCLLMEPRAVWFSRASPHWHSTPSTSTQWWARRAVSLCKELRPHVRCLPGYLNTFNRVRHRQSKPNAISISLKNEQIFVQGSIY